MLKGQRWQQTSLVVECEAIQGWQLSCWLLWRLCFGAGPKTEFNVSASQSLHVYEYFVVSFVLFLLRSD
jgi:hypothetical protein